MKKEQQGRGEKKIELSDLEKRILKEVRKKNFSQSEMNAILSIVKDPRPVEQAKHAHFGQKQTQVRIGIVGDVHVGSKCFDEKALHKFYAMAYQAGVREFYQVGDLVEGEGMYKGQAYEVYAHGYDAQIEAVARQYPYYEDAITYFITGNHDDSFLKLGGARVGKGIPERRPDMKYLGSTEATVLLGPKGKTKMMLLHPGGGSSYALSYRPQKIVESFEGGSKPHILCIGHFHKAGSLFYRNVHTILSGTFQNQTNFMKEKGLAAHKGSYILDMMLAEDGTVTSFQTQLIAFYH